MTEAPPQVEAFERVVASPEPVPNFRERSFEVSDVLHPWRVTAYFDIARTAQAPGPLGRLVAPRIIALAEDLGMAPPEALSRLLDGRVDPDAAIRQIAIGLDARPDPTTTRLKLYFIMTGDASRVTRHVCAALEVAPPPSASLALTHIVGIDLTRSGLHDVKLYYALDPGRVHRTVRDPRRWVRLFGGTQTFVFSHSLLTSRRSLHVRTRSPEVIWDEIGRLDAPASSELHAWLAAVGCTPAPGSRWQPAILALPFDDGALDPRRFSVYVHPAPSRKR